MISITEHRENIQDYINVSTYGSHYYDCGTLSKVLLKQNNRRDLNTKHPNKQ